MFLKFLSDSKVPYAFLSITHDVGYVEVCRADIPQLQQFFNSNQFGKQKLLTCHERVPFGKGASASCAAGWLKKLLGTCICEAYCGLFPERVLARRARPSVTDCTLRLGFWAGSRCEWWAEGIMKQNAAGDPLCSNRWPKPRPRWSIRSCTQEHYIAAVETIQSKLRSTAWNGYSMCRLCGKGCGCVEFEGKIGDVQINIPEGYLHYVRDHCVHPTYDELRCVLELALVCAGPASET